MAQLGCASATYLSSPILCCALGRGQLAPSLGTALTGVAVVRVAGAHVIGGAGDGWIDGVWGAGRVRMLRVLRERLHDGLAGACSEKVFS